jgi:hypothetical protein
MGTGGKIIRYLYRPLAVALRARAERIDKENETRKHSGDDAIIRVDLALILRTIADVADDVFEEIR